MSRPSSPILVSSRDSTPSPPTSPDEVERQIQLFRGRRLVLTTALRVQTPSPPSNSPDEWTSDGLDQAVHGRMTTTTITLTTAQIRRNAMEDARTYQDERIEELTNEDGARYMRTFTHAAMISHWATMFEELISTMITNFSAIPSIAIPAICNLPPPTISVTPEPELEYPPLEVDDWAEESIDETPVIPIPPPQHHIHPEVMEHLHTLHVAMPAPPTHTLGVAGFARATPPQEGIMRETPKSTQPGPKAKL